MIKYLAGFLTVFVFTQMPVLANDYAALVEPLDYYQQKRGELETKLAAAPGDIERVIELAELYRDMGDWEAGLELLEPLIAEDPGSETLSPLIAGMYLLKVNDAGLFGKMGAGKAMRNSCEAALEANPKNARAYHCLARYYFFAPGIAGGDKEKAGALVTNLEAVDPARSHIARAEQLSGSEDWDGAARAYADAVRANAGAESDFLVAAGMYHISREEWDRAYLYLKEATVSDPDSRLAAYQLGRLSVMSQDNTAEGAASLIRFLKGPTWFQGRDLRAPAHWRLGQIFQLQGETALAEKAFQQALSHDPKHKEAKKALKALKKHDRSSDD